MVEKKSVYNYNNSLIVVFTVLLVFSVIMIAVGNNQLREQITGFAGTTVSTVSNVTISSYLSIDMSANLTAGILFGTVSTLPSINVNATHNYDSGPNPPNESSFNLNVSTDSNSPVDFCIKSNDDLYDSTGGNRIGITNETYANSSTTNFTLPLITNEKSINTTYLKSSVNVAQGANAYYRFFLDVPAATAAATYNNTVMFKGVTNGSVCGT
jgi:hypothetical protein